MEGDPVWILCFTFVESVIIAGQRSNRELRFRPVTFDLKISVQISTRSSNFFPFEPPGDGSIWNSSGWKSQKYIKRQILLFILRTYTTQSNWPLVPRPFLVIQLVLKSWSKFHGDVARFKECPSFILRLTLVQTIICSVYFVYYDGRFPPERFTLSVVGSVDCALFDYDPVIVRLTSSVERFASNENSLKLMRDQFIFNKRF